MVEFHKSQQFAIYYLLDALQVKVGNLAGTRSWAQGRCTLGIENQTMRAQNSQQDHLTKRKPQWVRQRMLPLWECFQPSWLEPNAFGAILQNALKNVDNDRSCGRWQH